jgi:hypothetical protein
VTSEIGHQGGHFPLYAHDQLVRYKGAHLKLDVALVFVSGFVNFGTRIPFPDEGHSFGHWRPGLEVDVEVDGMMFRKIELMLLQSSKYIAVDITRPIHPLFF